MEIRLDVLRRLISVSIYVGEHDSDLEEDFHVGEGQDAIRCRKGVIVDLFCF